MWINLNLIIKKPNVIHSVSLSQINITVFHLKGMPSIKYITFMLYIKLRQIHHCPCLNQTNSSPPRKLARMR